MSYETIRLTTNKKALANIIRQHGTRSDNIAMYRRTSWLLAWYYLNGFRRFDVYDPTSCSLRPHLLDEEGNMEFQSQELLYAINQVAGRIESMDCRPSVGHQGTSLEGQRNRAIAQILCDAVVSVDQLRRLQSEFSYLFSCLGFAGLTGHMVDHPTIGLTSDIEVIHPRELSPFPVLGQDHTKARGILRSRWVSLDHLEDTYGRRTISAKRDGLEWYEIQAGEAFDNRFESPQPSITYLTGTTGLSAGGGDKGGLGIALVRELWLTGPQNTVTRYVCACGDTILQDDDLAGLEVYCPIGYARFMNNGSFHGAGMFDLLFSQHRMLEKLQKNLYNNIIDIDRYGILVLPQGEINQNQLLRDVGRGLRVMFHQPDPIAEGFSPFPITPFNSGDVPGRVAAFAREALRAVNPIQDIIQEKGRVDSASGLQFLEEQMTRALTSPTNGVVSAFSSLYKSITQKSAAMLAAAPRPIPVGSLTLDLAGAVIDPKTGTVDFRSNPLPSVSRLSFSVAAVSPKNTLARKQEAVDLWDKRIETDPVAFRLFAIKEGLDFAMWSDEERAAYEMGIRAILVLYGDGETPGQLILTPHTTRPEIVSRLASAFLCSPAMMHASVEVVNAMKMFRDTLLSFMGLTLPAAIPNPDDAALLSGGVAPPPGAPAPQGVPS